MPESRCLQGSLVKSHGYLFCGQWIGRGAWEYLEISYVFMAKRKGGPFCWCSCLCLLAGWPSCIDGGGGLGRTVRYITLSIR